MNRVPFEVVGRAGSARAGTLVLARNTVQTPVFMPVGTQAAVRSMSPVQVKETGTQILLANTYHLSQRPGEDLVKKAGGLHKFMGTDLPILTDSGGFQVFSLDKDVTEDGVKFRYEVDGRSTFLSPEKSMQIQEDLGSDIAMVFDECLGFGTGREETELSVERTSRWEARCKEAHQREDQSLFGIVQGGFWADLRQKSAKEIVDIGFDGYAVGGLSVGEGHEIMCNVLEATTPYLPDDRPRYLMGVGRPQDLVEGVARGIDMFDCVIQTRHARSGMLYTSRGRMRVTDQRYRKDLYPPDTSCTCYTCTTFSRAYLHHLFRVGEILGATLCSIHNVAWFQQFMARMRTAIIEGRFEEFRAEVHQYYPEDPRGSGGAVLGRDDGEPDLVPAGEGHGPKRGPQGGAPKSRGAGGPPRGKGGTRGPRR
jgi:queuine tRNA-ribosyltransferase